MAFTITVGKKDLDIKFNFRLMFKVNKDLATTDDNGNRQENGAGQLFINITERKDSALVDLIRIAANDKKLTDDTILDAIEDYAAEHGYEEMYDEIEKELLDSGFFLQKIQKTLEDMKFGRELMQDSKSEQEQMQAQAIDKVIQRLEKKISLNSGQE